jgi:hypothetical protein
MPNLPKLSCYEVIQCNRKQTCLLANDSEKPCWEVVKNDNACSFHICVDCLVYLAKQENPVFSEEDVYSILSKRKARGIGLQTECDLAYMLR